MLLPIVALGSAGARRLEARRLQDEVLARVDFVLHGGDEGALLAAANAVRRHSQRINGKQRWRTRVSFRICAIALAL